MNFSLFSKELLLIPPFIGVPREWNMTQSVMSHSKKLFE